MFSDFYKIYTNSTLASPIAFITRCNINKCRSRCFPSLHHRGNATLKARLYSVSTDFSYIASGITVTLLCSLNESDSVMFDKKLHAFSKHTFFHFSLYLLICIYPFRIVEILTCTDFMRKRYVYISHYLVFLFFLVNVVVS